MDDKQELAMQGMGGMGGGKMGGGPSGGMGAPPKPPGLPGVFADEERPDPRSLLRQALEMGSGEMSPETHAQMMQMMASALQMMG